MGDSDEREEAVEKLFDAFMDQALGEGGLEPEAFLNAHPEVSGVEREALFERLGAIARLARPCTAAPQVQATSSGLEDEELGRHIGEYRLIRSLGGGAMGEVYLAEQSSLGRLVALKTQRAHLAASPTAAARFEREARALGSLTHPSVVGVHGFGQDAEVAYLAMELVPGRSLKELLEEPRAGEAAPTPVAITRWGAELARGLEAVHAAGLVHRDVKPSNVRITEQDGGRAVLVDFGLARVGESSELSRTGEFIGSPAYASPEQVRGEKGLDGRSDVYSLGATLYRALAGRAPFEGADLEAVLHGVLTREPEPLSKRVPNLPRDLCLVVHKALEKEPARRYGSAAELARDLEAVLELRPVSAKPLGPAGRGLRWMRRNRLASAGFAAALLAVCAAGLYVADAARRDQLDNQRRAAAMLVDARAALADFRSTRLALAAEESEFDRLWGLQEYEYLGPERARRLESLEDGVRAARERRDRAFVRGENLLASALRLDPGVADEAGSIEARLVLERLIEANESGDKNAAAFLAVELERLDPDRSLREEAFPFSKLTLTSAVPGTEAWLLRYEPLDELVEGAEGRQVPLPIKPLQPDWAPAELVPLGSEVLRVAAPTSADWLGVEGDLITHFEGLPIAGGPLVHSVDPAPGLGEAAVQPGKRLTAIDGEQLADPLELETRMLAEPDVEHDFEFGNLRLSRSGLEANGVSFEGLAARAARLGGRVRLVHDGKTLETELPAGVELRRSLAAPLLLPDGQSPLEEVLTLEPGNYIAIARAPGHRLTRTVILALPGQPVEVDISPTAEHFAPPGFVLVSNSNPANPDFWIQEREVTSAEYLTFLNAAEQLARVDAGIAADRLELAPRVGPRGTDSLMWLRDKAGRFSLPASWPKSWPVLGVTLADAEAFARWKSQGVERGSFGLPAAWQTTIAGSSASGLQRFSWGARFDQRFANTCFSRAVARPESVLANPRDESPYGVFDVCGNALEWVTTWYDETRSLRHAIGGSWAQARIDTLAAGGGLGLEATASGGETGFRLIWIPPQGAAPAERDAGAARGTDDNE